MRSAARGDLGTAAECVLSFAGVNLGAIEDDDERARTLTGVVLLLDQFHDLTSELKLVRKTLTAFLEGMARGG